MLHISPPRIILTLHRTLPLHSIDDVAHQLLLLFLPRVLERPRHALPVASPRRLAFRPVRPPLVLRLQVGLEAALGLVGDAAIVALVGVPGVRAVLVAVPVVTTRYLE